MIGGLLQVRRPVLARLAFWSVLEAGQTFLLGYALARALDAGFLAGDARTGLLWLAAAALGVGVGAFGTRRVYGVVADLVEPVRDRLVTGVVARGVREADRRALSGLTQQVEIARDTLAGLVMVSRSFVFTVAGALAGLCTLAPPLLLVVVPPLLAGLGLFAATLRPLARRQEAFLVADEALAAELGEMCPGLRDVTAAGAEEYMAERVGKHVDGEFRAARALARWSVVRVAALAVGGQLPLVLLLATAPWLLAHGVTAGALIGALAYVTQSLLPALQNLVHGLGTSGARLTVVLRRLRPPSHSDAPTEAPSAWNADTPTKAADAPDSDASTEALGPRNSDASTEALSARNSDASTEADAPDTDASTETLDTRKLDAPAKTPDAPDPDTATEALGARNSDASTETLDTRNSGASTEAADAPDPARAAETVDTPHSGTPTRNGDTPDPAAPTKTATTPHAGASTATPAAPALALAGVTFAYGPASAPVLDGLDLCVPHGGHLAVVGPSGIGKSTLTAVAAGLLTPAHGEIRVYGHPVAGARAAALRVLIPQEAYVHTGTLAENLVLLRPDPVPEPELLAAAEAVGLTPLLERWGGPDAPVHPAELSAGERQLIALTRAYLSPAPLALLDEATCHLDPEAEARAERAFAVRPGGTLVVVAHRIASARRAQRILVMDGPRTAYGTHEDLLRTCALFQDLVAPARMPQAR
ncbi:ATP-binding cassette domain-containing protein [Streptomyces sp. NPDC096040]|uniref:ATP-binding cassette domain-containing protein n=1 Tax=Streptomyces sp. NPDC096040 TaxID=3155541 RepID=UPI00331B801C